MCEQRSERDAAVQGEWEAWLEHGDWSDFGNGDAEGENIEIALNAMLRLVAPALAFSGISVAEARAEGRLPELLAFLGPQTLTAVDALACVLTAAESVQ